MAEISSPAAEPAANDGFCRTSDDLFLPKARHTVYRLIPDFFVKNKVTVSEVMYRADLLDRLENAGMLIQHVIQKVAVAKSAEDGTPVQETIKHFDRLVSELYARVFNDKRDDVVPDAGEKDFGPLAAKLAAAPNGTYLLNSALAKYLRDARSWNEKAVRLARLVEVHRGAAGAAFLACAIDEILAEMLHMPSALQDFIGETKNFGEYLVILIDLFLGKGETGQYGKGQALTHLAQLFAAGKLPRAHASLGSRIVADISGLKRLCEDSVAAEMKLYRRVAVLAEKCAGEYMNREKLTDALELRAHRFVDSECLAACLKATELPDEKLAWLFFASDCIVGGHNKMELFNAAMHIVSSVLFDKQFRSPQIPLLKRLHRLAILNEQARQSGFAEELRRKLANLFDVRALDLAEGCKLFETLAAQPSKPAEKTTALMKLFAARTFTEPRLANKAREAVMAYVSAPDFLVGYIDHKLRTSGDELDRTAAAAEIGECLRRIGISPEASREALAA
jgi:hypothetical protein